MLFGVFLFSVPGENNLVNTPQSAWLIFSSGVLLSFLLAQKDKGVGLLCFLVFISFLRTILINKVPKAALFDWTTVCFSVFLIYFAIRHFNVQENILKYVLVPACLNILLVFLQAMVPQTLPFEKKEICGFFGNAGLTARFLGMITPIFIRYLKAGLPFLLAAILLCQGFVGLLAFMVCCLFVLRKNKKIFYALLVMSLIVFALICFKYSGQTMLRASMMAGTLNGIFYHWFWGWGLGSFVYVVGQVPPEESVYLGIPFNGVKYIMNHPHNEFLFGWWNFGLSFFIISLACAWNILTHYKKELSYSILLGGLVVMVFYFFTPPTLFLMTLALGIHENTNGGVENG